MSRNVLKGIEPQTCLDDLESFYYVLVYFARIHMGDKYPHRPLPTPLDYWDHPSAYDYKFAFLLYPFEYVIDPRLGKPFQTLVERLHSVFRDILVQALLADRGPPPVVNPEEVYDMMLSHVRDAIDDLNRETQDGITTPTMRSPKVDTDEDESQSSVKRKAMIIARRKIVRTLAANRERRPRPSSRGTDQVCIHNCFFC
jgi:hypothetical protein